MSNAPSRQSGDKVGSRYQLCEQIGAGGMGTVFRALDERLQRDVAVKLLHSRYSSRVDSEPRFLREAKIGARLSHPHLIQTYDFGRDADCLYLVMEFLRGQSVASFLTSMGSLEVRYAAALSEQVASGLAAAHQQGLVHRDLKPENIFLTSETPPHCKILDFGLSVVVESEDEQLGRLTSDGSIGGTPRYMAPEQLRGKTPESASDVYALGCVMHEFLVGSPPFDLDTLGEVAAHHFYAPIPDLTREHPGIPRVLAELVRRCLAKKPRDRPSAEQVSLRLREFRLRAVNTRDGQNDPAARDEELRQAFSDLPTVTLQSLDELPQSVEFDLPIETIGRVLLRGDARVDTIVALRASGFKVREYREHEDISKEDADLILCIGVSDKKLQELANGQIPVVSDVVAGDIERISQLLRMGLVDLIPRPVRPDLLVSKLRRVIRKKKRRASARSSKEPSQ